MNVVTKFTIFNEDLGYFMGEQRTDDGQRKELWSNTNGSSYPSVIVFDSAEEAHRHTLRMKEQPEACWFRKINVEKNKSFVPMDTLT